MKIQIEFQRPQWRVQRRFIKFQAVLLLIILALTIATSRLRADTGTCSGVSVTLPFNDVMSSAFFCQIAAAYFSGLTNGTTATTYSPGNVVTREQMATFITRTQDQSLRRGSRRAALGQWWTNKGGHTGSETFIGGGPATDVVCDGATIWVAFTDRVGRVRASDGMLDFNFGTVVTPAQTLLAIGGRVYVAGGSILRYIEKDALLTVSTDFAADLQCLAFDGQHLWTGSNTGVLSKVSARDNSVTTLPNSFGILTGMVYDGSNVWVCERDNFIGQIHKLASNGTVLQTLPTGARPGRPVFDGTNIWVPNRQSNSVTVIRVKDASGGPLASAFVLAGLTGNSLSAPVAASFDGERILIANGNVNTVSLWKATDLAPLGAFFVGPSDAPGLSGACSDGLNFWLTVYDRAFVYRF
jgi:hypothetical protein